MKVVNHLVGRKKVMIAPGVKLMMIWKVSWLTDTAIHDMIIIEAARPSGHIGPRGPIHCLPPPWECFSCVLIIIIAVRKRGSYLEYERNYSRHCQSNGWYMTEKKWMQYGYFNLQPLEELQLLPSIQQLPIPMSSALGRQALEEKLWIRLMVLMLGNLSKPRGSSKLDIVEAL